MKKVIVISIMSLIFLATYAQRPSKSSSTEVSNTDRKKSEMTTERSGNNTSRSVEMKSDRSENVNTSRTVTSRDEDPAGNVNRNNSNSNTNSNRSITDKINDNKSDLHKNGETGRSNSVESRSGYTAKDGRGNSINSRTYEVERKNYNTPSRERVHRQVYTVNKPSPVEYRRIHHPYRVPVNIHIIWTPRMYYEYRMIYPEYRYWYYHNGYRIRTISAYDAIYYTGELVNVYGRIHEVWYCRETDEYFLYFGARYPYHDFSVVIPGNKARQFSRRPGIFFEGRYIWVTGLISLHQGKPEMIIRKKHQIHLY